MPPSPFIPMWSGELELSSPSLPERLADPDGGALQRARLLVRARGTPLGFLELDAPDGRLEVERAAAAARASFGEAAARALAYGSWARASPAPDSPTPDSPTPDSPAPDSPTPDSPAPDSATPDSATRVSVVLCTRNRADGAGRTLESLLACAHREIEIIVVDNAPRDESTRTLVGELTRRDPRVRYVREDRRGLSCARNRGLREADGEIVAFTDDDVRVDPLWISGLLRGFGRSPEVACVTGLVASASLRRRAEQYFDRRVWWSSSCDPRLFTADHGGDSPLHPYTAGMFGTGANFAARTAVLRDLGGFDECLGAGSPAQGGEDLDLFVRLLTAGHALAYEPSALVWHEHRVDDASLRRQMYAYGLGLSAYMTKHLLARSSRSALLRRLPGVARHALTLVRRSRRAVDEASLELPGMTGVELRGVLAGPLAYARARRSADPDHIRAVAP